ALVVAHRRRCAVSASAGGAPVRRAMARCALEAQRDPRRPVRRLGGGALVALGAMALACQSSKPGAGPGSGSAASASTTPVVDNKRARSNPAATANGTAPAEPPPPPRPEPLTGSAIVPLTVVGFGTASDSVPLGARERRPVVIALHGNYDRPEWQCQVWREITGGTTWVLCPRGVPRGDAPRGADRWTYAGADKLEAELDAALVALAR